MASIYFQVSPMSGSGDGTISVNPSGANDTYYDLQSSISVDNGVSSRTINAIHYGIPHIWLMNGTNVYPGTGGTKSFDCSTHYDVWFSNIPYWIHITDASGNTWGEGDIISAETADSIEFLISADENYFPTSRDTGQNYFCMKHLLRNETGIPIEYIYLIQESGTDDTYLIVTPRELRWNSYDTREREVSVQCNHEWGAYLNDGRFTMRVSGNTILISPIGENTTSADFSDIVIVSARSVTTDVTLLQTCEANDYYLRVNPSSILFDCSGYTSNSAVTISTNLPSWSASLSSGTKFSITTGVNKVYITANGDNASYEDYTDTIIVTAGELTEYVSVLQKAYGYIRLVSGGTDYITYPYNALLSEFYDYYQHGIVSGDIYSALVETNISKVYLPAMDYVHPDSMKAPEQNSYWSSYLPYGEFISSSQTIYFFCPWIYGSGDTQSTTDKTPPFQILKAYFRKGGRSLGLTMTNISIARQYLLSDSANGSSVIGVGPKNTMDNYGEYHSGETLTFNLRTAVLPTTFEIRASRGTLSGLYTPDFEGVTILDASGNTITPNIVNISGNIVTAGEEVTLLPLTEDSLKNSYDYPIRLVVPGTDTPKAFYFGVRYRYPNGDSGTCFTQYLTNNNSPKDRFLILRNGLLTWYKEASTFYGPFYMWDDRLHPNTDCGTITIEGEWIGHENNTSISLPTYYGVSDYFNFTLSSSTPDFRLATNIRLDNGNYVGMVCRGNVTSSSIDGRYGFVNPLRYPQSARTASVIMKAMDYTAPVLDVTQYAPPMVTMDGDEIILSAHTTEINGEIVDMDAIVMMDSASTYSNTIDFVGTDPFTYNFKILYRCNDGGLNLKLIDGDGNLVDNYSESGMGATLRFNFPTLSDAAGTNMTIQVDVTEEKGAHWEKVIYLHRGDTRCLPVTGGTFFYPNPV